MRRILLLLALVACSAPAASTTTATSPTTTLTSSTTTGPASTTSAVTTTLPATTSTVPADGTLPFIVSGSGLIGWYDGSHWIPSDLDSPVEGGESYQVIDLNGLVGESVGSEIEICEPAGTPLVDLNPPLLIASNEPGEVAVANAGWNLLPRPVDQSSEPPADLVAEGIDFIGARGLSDSDANVAQYLAFDLEGDGTDEEILVLNWLPNGLIGNASSYSLVLMRKQLDVEPATLIVAYSQGVDDSPYVVSYFVSAIADLNGDDKMEVVVDGDYYEGSGTSVYEYLDDDLGLVEVLAGGCGA